MIRDDDLSPLELLSIAVFLVGAGFQSTANLFGNGIVLLLQHPEQLTMLRENPDLWPGAIEEVLRFSPLCP